MARTPKNEEMNINENIVDVEKEQLIKENNELKEQMSQFTGMFEALQKQIQDLQTQNTYVAPIQAQPVQFVESNDIVYVGSNMMGKTELIYDTRSGRGITIYGHKKPIGLTKDRVGLLLENNKFRKFFEKGLLYFVDKEMYQKYSVYTDIVLNDETIIEVLKLSSDNLLRKFVEITNNKTDNAVTHNLLFRIAYLLRNNMVQGFDFRNNLVINDFFGADIGKTISLLELKEKEE